MLDDCETTTGNGDRRCMLDLSPPIVMHDVGDGDRPCLLDLPAFGTPRAKRSHEGRLKASGIRSR
jgi:hypothetical protein